MEIQQDKNKIFFMQTEFDKCQRILKIFVKNLKIGDILK